MPNDEILTDDYVAGLLAKDAQDCSAKYSTIGMEAYHARKKPANLPKPNTRFLRNVIKDTNSHNAALLAREASEAHARLERLEKADGRGRRVKPGEIRRRQIGSINAILGPQAPKRAAEEAAASSSRKESRRESGADSRRRSRSRDGARKTDKRRRDGRDMEGDQDRHGRARIRGGADDSLGRKKQRRDGPSPHDDDRRRSGRESSHRRRSRSPSRRERRHRERSTSRHRQSRKSKTSGRGDPGAPRDDGRKETAAKPDRRNGDGGDHMSDSDPLDDFVGPAPPPTKSPIRTKGRGTISAFSGIDQRFAADYDPKLDIEMDDDDDDKATGKDDWSEAVEVFRDRQKLRQAREERMRAAGFSEEEVGKWGELGKKVEDTREKTEADVKWAKAGEKREWDIGKEMG